MLLTRKLQEEERRHERRQALGGLVFLALATGFFLSVAIHYGHQSDRLSRRYAACMQACENCTPQTCTEAAVAAADR